MQKYSQQLYFLAVIPPQPIYDEVWNIKKNIEEDYQSKASLNSPPHITLHMPFKWREDREDKLISTLEKVSVEPFQIELKDFKAFVPRVIYIDLVQNEDLRNLWNAIVVSMSSLNILNADYKNRGFTPHMTVAFRDLRKEMFKKAWEIFKNTSFSASWEVNSFSLLKHNGKIWEVFKSFPLTR
ncbi:MAG: 2'-5' RNA ligase family protein [Cyclobacteriaceae bacterium]|nr:2'-5' RNA ligase family protein [Cyclobacteriaceae bacterium]